MKPLEQARDLACRILAEKAGKPHQPCQCVCCGQASSRCVIPAVWYRDARPRAAQQQERAILECAAKFYGDLLCQRCWDGFRGFVRQFDPNRVIPEAAAVVWLMLPYLPWDDLTQDNRLKENAALMERGLASIRKKC